MTDDYPRRTTPYLTKASLAEQLDAHEADADALSSTRRTEARMHVIESLRETFGLARPDDE